MCVCVFLKLCAKDIHASACGQSLILMLEVKMLLKFAPIYHNKGSIIYMRMQNNTVIRSAVTHCSDARKNISDHQKEVYVIVNVLLYVFI